MSEPGWHPGRGLSGGSQKHSAKAGREWEEINSISLLSPSSLQLAPPIGQTHQKSGGKQSPRDAVHGVQPPWSTEQSGRGQMVDQVAGAGGGCCDLCVCVSFKFIYWTPRFKAGRWAFGEAFHGLGHGDRAL